MIKFEKRQVKMISLATVVLFLLGVVGMTILTTSTYAATSASSNIGVVNYQLLVAQHPDVTKAQEIMQASFKEAQSTFDARSATMNDKEKQAYYQQLQQGLQIKEQDLLNAINDKVIAAVKVVANEKGLGIVIDYGTGVYGGQDITEEVKTKINGK